MLRAAPCRLLLTRLRSPPLIPQQAFPRALRAFATTPAGKPKRRFVKKEMYPPVDPEELFSLRNKNSASGMVRKVVGVLLCGVGAFYLYELCKGAVVGWQYIDSKPDNPIEVFNKRSKENRQEQLKNATVEARVIMNEERKRS